MEIVSNRGLAALTVVLAAACGGQPARSAAASAKSPAIDSSGSQRSEPDIPSCEEAAKAYRASEGVGIRVDPSTGYHATVLNEGRYLNECAVPHDSGVVVCAAIRNGRAEGITVRIIPEDLAVEECVAQAVKRLAFPATLSMVVARTHFPPESAARELKKAGQPTARGALGNLRTALIDAADRAARECRSDRVLEGGVLVTCLEDGGTLVRFLHPFGDQLRTAGLEECVKAEFSRVTCPSKLRSLNTKKDVVLGAQTGPSMER